MQPHLDYLFRSKLRQKLLRYWLEHPKKDFYVRELAQVIHEDAGNCSRELKNLQHLGLVASVTRGSLKFYSLKQDHPDWPKLQEIFRLTQVKREAKIVYFVVGPNGSGKSTLAKDLVEEKDLLFLNADVVASKLSPDDLTKVRLRAGRLFLDHLHEAVEGGGSFIVESTFAGRYWRQWIPRLKKRGYALRASYIFVDSAEEAVLRIRVRIKKGGHRVPEEDIRRRFQRSKTNFWNEYRQQMDHWKIFLNSQDELIPVAFGAREEMQVINEAGFQLFKEGIV